MNKGDQTRQMIIEKAAELFNKSGYDGCSLSDIMKATNLQKGGIYNHFKNKDEIALESFDYLFQKLANLYRTSTHGATSSREKLEQIFNMFENHYSNPEIKGGCPIANTAVYSADAHPQLREKVNKAIQTIEDYITIKIDEGKASGEFRKDLSSRETAIFILAAFEGAVVLTRSKQNKKYLRNTVSQLRQYLMNLMA